MNSRDWFAFAVICLGSICVLIAAFLGSIPEDQMAVPVSFALFGPPLMVVYGMWNRRDEQRAAAQTSRVAQPATTVTIAQKAPSRWGIGPEHVTLFFAAVIVGMLLFPPWYFKPGSNPAKNAGYSFVFSPPEMSVTSTSTKFPCRLDWERLVAQCIAVAAVGGLVGFCVWRNGQRQSGRSLRLDSVAEPLT